MTSFIGREHEQQLLTSLLSKATPSFVAVYGRRRVGKSSLIQHFGEQHRFLKFEGLHPRQGITKQDQLDEFSRQLARQCNCEFKRFNDWSDAFFELNKHTQKGRVVIALDELSWMALEDEDFAGKLKIAWDNHFKKNPKLILIVCGSVSAWIRENIVCSTGFHGRVSLTVNLKPLPLEHCKRFWGNHEKKVSAIEKLKLIAVTGGIPKYLEEINPTQSAEENIRRLAFSESGILFNDFKEIFTDTLLRKSEKYENIIRLLADGAIEASKIAEKLGLESGGYLTSLLEELIVAGFVSKHASWHLSNGKPSTISQYRLQDNYLRFYLKYIEPNIEKIIAGNFKEASINALPGWSTMMSLQIENLVLGNRDKIKSLLKIKPDEIICDNPYYQRATKSRSGCQIDYLVQTKFNTLHICEVKFTKTIIRKYIIDEMEEKIKRLNIPRHTSVRPVLIHAGDIHDEVLDAGYFAAVIDLGSLLR